MKFLLFGTGEYYNRYKIWFEKEDVVALIDNAEAKQGKKIDDLPVISPKDIGQYAFDVIVIMSFYVKEMKAQLTVLGIEEDRIFHFYDLHGLIGRSVRKREIICYGTEKVHKESSKNILLLNQDLTLGGPALALYHAARVLAKRGYRVTYGSMLDGPLRDMLIREGIPVVVDENLLICTMRESKWVEAFSLVICNTINFHVFLSERNTKIPIVWWLHDALFFYDGADLNAIKNISKENMKIWAVGPVSGYAVKTFRPDFQVEDLLYGVEETGISRIGKADKEKIRFTVIGYIEARKGQDVFVDAIQKLEQNVREKAEFYFVGQDTSVMASKIKEITKNIPEIRITGPVSREKVEVLLEETDVLVCPSRSDPMPTVAAEAMMHGIPCLISNAAGTVRYLQDGMDSMIFQSEDTDQLQDMLEKCIMGTVDLKKMGQNSRKVFENYFSMNIFEERFMRLVREIDF